MIYTLGRSDDYLCLVWDSVQIDHVLRSTNQNSLDNRIDMNHEPRSWKHIFNEPVPLSFPILKKEDEKRPIPEILAYQGRLFLSMKAYDAVKNVIENDGEFVHVTYEHGDAYVFVPFHIAEEIGALDEEKSIKDKWGDVETLAFHEEKIKAKGWNIFRCEFNSFITAQVSQEFKDVIEKAGLKGTRAITELGYIFSVSTP